MTCKFFGPQNLSSPIGAVVLPVLAGASSWPGWWSAVPLSVRAPLVSDAQALTCISPLIYHQLLFSHLSRFFLRVMSLLSAGMLGTLSLSSSTARGSVYPR